MCSHLDGRVTTHVFSLSKSEIVRPRDVLTISYIDTINSDIQSSDVELFGQLFLLMVESIQLYLVAVQLLRQTLSVLQRFSRKMGVQLQLPHRLSSFVWPFLKLTLLNFLRLLLFRWPRECLQRQRDHWCRTGWRLGRHDDCLGTYWGRTQTITVPFWQTLHAEVSDVTLLVRDGRWTCPPTTDVIEHMSSRLRCHRADGRHRWLHQTLLQQCPRHQDYCLTHAQQCLEEIDLRWRSLVDR